MDTEAEFWTSMDSSGGPYSCWPWKLGRVRQGYGQVCWRGVINQKAHRVAYELVVGPIAAGASILHSCDNPPCCNPRHLREGDNQENALDRVRRLRAARPKGMGSHKSKLRDEDIVAIAKLYAQGNLTQREIAARFSISQTQVSGILMGRSWSHIDRQLFPRVIRGGRERLTPEKITEIREKYYAGKVAQKALAREYHLSDIVVRNIVHGKDPYDLGALV